MKNDKAFVKETTQRIKSEFYKTYNKNKHTFKKKNWNQDLVKIEIEIWQKLKPRFGQN